MPRIECRIYFLAKLGSLIIWKYSVLLRYINKIWTVVWLCGLFPQNWMQILFQWILQDSLSIYTYICSSPYIIHFILNNDAEAAAAAAASTATAQIEEQNERKKTYVKINKIKWCKLFEKEIERKYAPWRVAAFSGMFNCSQCMKRNVCLEM